MNAIKAYTSNIDWILFASLVPLIGAGLLTMSSFSGENYFFSRQLLWIGIAVFVFFTFSHTDWRFLKRTDVLATLFLISVGTLTLLLLVGGVIRGAQSWVKIGNFVIQPSDPIKILVVLLLAKYFSRRHIEIAQIRHIFVSGVYALIPFLLIFFQPDFGSAIIIFAIWIGMIMASGISKKHLLGVCVLGGVSLLFLWSFVFADYQRDRIMTFINPLTDVEGAGYNANQSMIAVGSGSFFGRGVGYGTQSRLEFLPEHQTDFIFAAFAEEWGFVGVVILFALFGVVIWRVLFHAMLGVGNFEILFGVGVAVLLISHFVIHVGMNIGLLPVTGITLPFLSYGGSHLITEFAALGMLMGMRRYSRSAHRDDMRNELIGV
jgi:rod shape determining protein RodA